MPMCLPREPADADKYVKSVDMRGSVRSARLPLTNFLPPRRRLWLANMVSPSDWRAIDNAVSGVCFVELSRSQSRALAQEVAQRAAEAVQAGLLSPRGYEALKAVLPSTASGAAL